MNILLRVFVGAISILCGMAFADEAAPSVTTSQATQDSACRIVRNRDGYDTSCLPSISADQKSVAVVRHESGSMTVFVFSTNGHLLRQFHVVDVFAKSSTKETITRINDTLAAGSYRHLQEALIPSATLARASFVAKVSDGLSCRYNNGRLEILHGDAVLGLTRSYRIISDAQLGVQHPLVGGVFFSNDQRVAVVQFEYVSSEGFAYPGGTKWEVLRLKAEPVP